MADEGNWFRRLHGDRIEIFLKAKGYKIRAHGPEAKMFELVDLFEGWTGLRVGGQWRRVRTGPKPLEGQQTLLVDEAPSHGATVPR